MNKCTERVANLIPLKKRKMSVHLRHHRLQFHQIHKKCKSSLPTGTGGSLDGDGSGQKRSDRREL